MALHFPTIFQLEGLFRRSKCRQFSVLGVLEKAWEASILPLNYARFVSDCRLYTTKRLAHALAGCRQDPKPARLRDVKADTTNRRSPRIIDSNRFGILRDRPADFANQSVWNWKVFSGYKIDYSAVDEKARCRVFVEKKGPSEGF